MLTELAVLDINGKPIPCGSFDEMEKKYCEFAALQKQYNKQNANYLSQDQLYKNDCSPPKPVDVDNTVIEYIKEKYPQEWKKIIGKDVKMDSGKMFFNSKQTVLAHFARQKFITLYQKIATELQEQTLPCKPSQRLLLEAEFPELLLTPCPDKQSIHVTGGYVSMERLSRFLKNYFQSPVRSTGHAAPKASIKDSYPPATQDSKKDEEETCPICMDTLTEKQMLPKCKHSFCKDCLKRAFDFKPACPICGVLYGKLKGTQPEKGTMKVTYEASHLPGYEKYGTIVINYYIPSGIQGVSIHQFTSTVLWLDLAKFCQANSVTL